MSRKILSPDQKYACNIAGLYLSLYDQVAYQKLSDTDNISQSKVHEMLASKFKVAQAFIKINRDQFDFHTSTKRIGFRQDLSDDKQEILDKYKTQKESVLYKELQRILDLEYVTSTTEEKVIGHVGEKIKIRQFTHEGKIEFDEFYRKIVVELERNNEISQLPLELLIGENNSEILEFSGEIEINKKFENRYELGIYLHKALNDCDERKLIGNDNLWNWISAAFFSNIFPGPRGGSQDIRYLLSDRERYHYRHICYFSWFLYREFGEGSKFCLASPTNTNSDALEQIGSRRSLLNNNSLNLLSKMYLIEDEDSNSFRIKKGIFSTKLDTPGSLRRLEKIHNRLSTNYDVSDMPFLEFKSSILDFTDEFDEYLE